MSNLSAHPVVDPTQRNIIPDTGRNFWVEISLNIGFPVEKESQVETVLGPVLSGAQPLLLACHTSASGPLLLLTVGAPDIT